MFKFYWRNYNHFIINVMIFLIIKKFSFFLVSAFCLELCSLIKKYILMQVFGDLDTQNVLQ